MAINNKNVSTRTKPGGMTAAAWATELATKTAAQLAIYDVTAPVFCCDDSVQACADHDSDVAGLKTAYQAMVAKVQSTGVGSLTVGDIAPVVYRLVNCMKKNYEKS
jgi:hypothetical protein